MDKEKTKVATLSKKERSSLLVLELASGIVLYAIILFPNISPDLGVIEGIVFSFIFLAIFLIPNILYLIIALKLKAKMKLLISGSFLVISQWYFTIASIINVTNSSNSTAGVEFLVIWIPTIIALLFGLLIGYFIERAMLKNS